MSRRNATKGGRPSRSRESSQTSPEIRREAEPRTSAGFDGAPWRGRIGCLLIAAATIVAYSNSFSGEFIVDDTLSIVQNRAIRSLWPLTEYLVSSRPLVDYSLGINYALHGLEREGYHVVNLAIHILAACTLFALVRRTQALHANRISAAKGSHDRLPNVELRDTPVAPALIIALLWAVHPLQTQAVTYIIQRSESLMGLCYLLVLYCVARSATGPHAGLWRMGAITAGAAGMASKAVMVSAPIVALLYDRVFIASSFRELIRKRWSLHVGLAATWSVLAIFGVVGGIFAREQADPITVGFGTPGLTAWEYLRTQPEILIHYLRLSFIPVGQCIDYGWPVAGVGPRMVLCGALVAGLLLGSVRALKRRPWVGFIGVAFFLILAPTSSIVPIRDLAFEHRMYLPLAGVIVLVVLGIGALLHRIITPDIPRRLLAGGATLAAVLVLAALTYRRNALYGDVIALWRDNVARTPNHPRPHNALGFALLQSGGVPESISEFDEAIRLDPSYAGAWANLGVARLKQGDASAAVERMEKALALSPYEFDAELYYYLGSALFETGQFEPARERFGQALQMRPVYPEALCSLGNALRALGRLAEAEAALQASLRDAPNYAVAWANLGVVLSDLNRLDEAVRAYERALKSQVGSEPDPAFTAQVYVRLGRLQERMGRPDEARRNFAAALKIAPGDLEARKGMGLEGAGPSP
ncbi:lipoprotein NlpI [Phycisphaerae bacterium RAS2]|nr:lipoprotein NlpI [Phycisphaerae bacterium RAS2]